MKEIEFKLRKISASVKLSYMINPEISISKINSGLDDDYISDTLTARMDAYIAEHKSDELLLSTFCERPKFFDWLFRRGKWVNWKISVNDYLVKPPPDYPETMRLYFTEQMDPKE